MTHHCYRKLDTCSVAVLDMEPYHPDGVKEDGYIITRINVPFLWRGKGIASEMLKDATKHADLYNKKIWLEIQSSDGLNYDQLADWYKRYGFKDLGNFFLRRPA